MGGLIGKLVVKNLNFEILVFLKLNGECYVVGLIVPQKNRKNSSLQFTGFYLNITFQFQL
jgi:hypothetical protein